MTIVYEAEHVEELIAETVLNIMSITDYQYYGVDVLLPELI